jgi:FAD/FMN-containing dehydrogenase
MAAVHADAMSTQQASTPIDAVRALGDTLKGVVLLPDDPDYDEARRVWNGMIDRRPLAIVRASGIDDIAPVIEFARDAQLPLAIRGGGHGVAGNGVADGGIVLDMGALNGVEVDPEARLVKVGAGATLADIDRATEPFGLAVPIGVVSGTGIAGLTLGGGIGWLTRAHGLTIDNLVAADVVTATGEHIRASESENSDLFWGLRGGGGNFGVVTSFTFRAHPLDQDVLAGTFIYERPHWQQALQAYAEWTADLPDAMTSIITFTVPPEDWELGDEVLMFVGFAWAGPDRTEGEAAIAGLREASSPDAAVLDPTRWIAWQSAFDAMVPKGVRAYWKNASFERLDHPMIETIVDQAGAQTWYGTAADLHHMAGAYGRVAEETTPFPNRGAGYWLNIYGFWPDAEHDRAGVAWVRGFFDAVSPYAMVGQYVNFLGHDETRVDDRQKALAAYGPHKLERLVALKRRYDPGNLFRINHNIPPG